MKRPLAIAAAAMAAVASLHAVEIDGVAAKVGSDTILRSDVINEMRRLGHTDASGYASVRNDMIDRKLILRAAAESKMTMQEWVVENRVREIVNKAFGGDRNKLIESLGKQKVSFPEWLARMKEDMIVGAMRWQVVDKNVTASPAAMRREYAEHPERYRKDHRVTVLAIMLKPEERDRRDEISRKLKDTDFEALGGRRFTDIKPEEAFRPEICREISEMPKGTVSHWIELDGWSFLLKKESEADSEKLSFADAYDQIAANVKEAAAKRLYTEWVDRLRAETYIKTY